ncbi:MAG: hypothetical protein HY901_24615 [Deltaproteobacteria bacterium]|nr:hypothetical protein [Deltaproteobacteria bacterium]
MNHVGQEQAGARGALSDIEERIAPQMEMVRERLDHLNQRALHLMRTYPGTCLLGAIGVGFLLGRLASRR